MRGEESVRSDEVERSDEGVGVVMGEEERLSTQMA